MTTKARGRYLAEWEDLGEGYSGDYDPDDPDDVPLLRFSVIDLMTGEQLDDASYCTLMPVGTDPAILERGLELLLDAAESTYRKKEFESLSWMKPEDFKLTEDSE